MNRREAEELLPWYVAGALPREEMEAVQAFVERGEISVAELEEVRFVGEAVGRAGAEEPRYDPQILQRVLDRLDGIPQEPPVDEEPVVVVRERLRQSKQRRFGEAGAGWLSGVLEGLQWAATPPLARVAIAAQFALLLGLTVALTLDDSAADGGYVVASGEVAGDYTLTFGPGVTEAQVRALLLESRATIVAGPSAIGLYTIELDANVNAEEAAERLQASRLVTFLQPTPRR